MTDIDLDAIEARANAATEGPWWRREGYAEIEGQNYAEVLIPGRVECGSYCYGGTSTIDGDRLDADLAFIAAARTDLPAVVAALRGALAEVERWVDAHAVLAREVDELRRALGVENSLPADVPMSSDRGHDLRERIAQRIDQAWAVAKDSSSASSFPEYREGYLDGLEFAERVARSTPLTEGDR